ncbi:bifunctional proline dehydrogenase/L-glutamate gamma-semialdehyde dehydrogenase [Demequina sp. SYSU T00192]|uniref:L-glutamate gamma-semialdehyde dehydrogenase n=1 Tax=Demequina litoralis TaxID=3051660 RepID=A0ABT8G5K9_9MICO|nr:bifunctional proline dehydrogenase/L-glutamate gamma-semialdehyde dehydrogenase [Demequina sp. SYSU T00192]MDN4474418.1 bifunctional proline dehydrogenase/L-glutamate gamma-semialdehyde dehydrogenase [Demequina sp. SYSU T00192]
MTMSPLAPERLHTADDTVAQVRTWLEASRSHRIDGSARLLARMLRDPQGLPFLTDFVDGIVRPEDTDVAAASLRRLVRRGHAFLPGYQRVALRAGALASYVAPGLVVGVCRRVVREMVGHLIVDASEDRLGRVLARLRSRGSRLNLNLLGEAVLGAAEADRRLERTLALLERPDVDYVSLKVSAAVAPHSPWAFDATVDAVVERLAPLYELAARKDGAFVNLDMEEYRDLDLTVAVFTRLLERPGLEGLTAGIVLQAYLPDSLGAMRRLQDWAAQRVARGGAPIKVRLVKGANLSMERVDAEQHGWPLATWGSKEESDAHYKRLLDLALTPESLAHVRLGVAGHNLFDIAHALLTARERGITAGLDFEMLLGMGEHVAAAVAEDAGPLRLYTPVVHPGEFDVALAYLVRRLEEVASPENFMSALFDLDDDATFAREEARFRASLARAEEPAPASHRDAGRAPAPAAGFVNAADTDPSLPASRTWARAIHAGSRSSQAGLATLGAARVEDDAAVAAQVAAAKAGASAWQALAPEDRAAILHAAGRALEARRGDLVAVMMAEAGKTIDQADPEVSEAVDFAHYYAERSLDLHRLDGARPVPRDVTVVTPPWNFPVAIPAGSTLAALAAASAVVLKPAEQSARCGALLAEILWEAGVPRDALRLVDISAAGIDAGLGDALLGHADVDQVILTGAYETGALFHRVAPGLRLFAETSGKNAIVVTPSADLDLAARDVVQSAFGHAGQKCSAASLVILVGSVATSRRFLTQLEDAVRSLHVGPADDPTTQMGPVIEPARGKLLRALTTLEPGERWLVEPRRLDDEGRTWTPGVRTGVTPGSWFHLTECFGPVLGIMTAATLDEAIALQNGVDYGLTAGLHSLEGDEISRWLGAVEAGNVYVNRGITGAIVQRQPFGGWKRSVVGPTAKAGGPSYLVQLTGWERTEPSTPSAAARLPLLADAPGWVSAAAEADARAWDRTFGTAVDRSRLGSERNALRYAPAATEIRWDGADEAALQRVCAARILAGGTGGLSSAVEPAPRLRALVEEAGLAVTIETEEELVARVAGDGARVRAVGAAPRQRIDLAVYDAPVTGAPEVELLPFLREQAVAVTMHRFGTAWPVADAVVAEL